MTEPLFFALWPGTGARRSLEHLRRSLPRHGGREPHPADLHVTLAYLGAIPPARRVCAEQIAGGIRADPFELRIDTLGHWRRPGILWCAPSVIPAPLLNLFASLNGGLAACGVTLEPRRFKPHITLARKVPHGLRGAELEAFDWPVSDFVLAAGRQGRRPRFRILARWALRS